MGHRVPAARLVPDSALARAYSAAESLVKRRATDVVVLFAVDLDGDLSTFRVGVVVNELEDVVDVVLVSDNEDGEATKLTFTPHYDVDDWEPQASNPRWERTPGRHWI